MDMLKIYQLESSKYQSCSSGDEGCVTSTRGFTKDHGDKGWQRVTPDDNGWQRMTKPTWSTPAKNSDIHDKTLLMKMYLPYQPPPVLNNVPNMALILSPFPPPTINDNELSESTLTSLKK